jgi:hypothetical protein
VGSIFTAWAEEGAVQEWLDRPTPELEDTEKEKYREVLEVVRHDQQAVVLIVDRAWRFGTSASIATSSNNEMVVPLLSNSRHRVYYIGIPVFDLQGKVSFGLFTSGTSTRLSVERINELADRLHDAAFKAVAAPSKYESQHGLSRQNQLAIRVVCGGLICQLGSEFARHAPA